MDAAAAPIGDPQRAVPGPVGGWTGFWIVAWAALVGVPAAFLAGALLTVGPFVALAQVQLEALARQQQVPPGAVLDPFAVIRTASLALADATWPWLAAITVLAILLGAAGLRVVRGAEGGRRAARWLLAALVAATAVTAVHLVRDALPAHAARADALRAAVHDLAIAAGQQTDGDLLDRLAGGAWLDTAVLLAAAAVALPSLGLWLAAGRRALREWCRPGAGPAPG